MRCLLILFFCLLPAFAQAQSKPATPAKTHTAKKEIPAPAAPADANVPEYMVIVLQGLNKVTGHISKFEGPVGTVLRFGNLEIVARRCWKSAPEDQPENAALLEISALKPGEDSKRIFLGWMFSSSPGLSSLENPVYDITVLSCESRKEPEAGTK